MVKRVLKVVGFGIFLLMLAIPSMSQNTKGDKPTTNRETRFKKASKSEKPSKRIRSGRRTTSSLRAYKPRKKSKGGERAGRPLSPVFNSKPGEKPKKVYPQSGPFVHNPSKKPRSSDRTRASRFDARRVNARSTGSTRNVYPQSSRYVNYSSNPDRKPPRKRKVVPRSASGSFTARRSIHSWAHYPKSTGKRERAHTGDIAGRRLRTKNFETKRPPIIKHTPGPRVATSPSKRSRNVYPQSYRYARSNYSSKPKKTQVVSNKSTLAMLKTSQNRAERKPKGPGKVIPRSATRPYMARKSPNTWAHFPRPKKKSERAITTDIAGKRLRTKNFETQRPSVLINPTARPYKFRKKIGDRPYKGTQGGYVSATRSGKAWRGDVSNRRIRKNYSSKRGFEGQPILSPERRKLGIRDQGEGYTGSIKARRPLKGGGSLSGKLWNNKRSAIPARTPGIGARGIGKYQGNLKTRGTLQDQGEEFTGNLKSRRPLKGGGSRSGKLWNNNARAISGRTPGIGAKGIERYQGNIRFGGKNFRNQGEEFTGSVKAKRPAKGGGSVSGKLWNNKQAPIAVRTPSTRAAKAGNYTGNIKAGLRVFKDQGEEYTGAIKTKRPAKGGGSVSGKLWNNSEKPIEVRTPKSEQGGESSGKLKLRTAYLKNPNAAESAIKVRRPRTTYAADGLQIKVRQPEYGRRKDAPEGSIPGVKASKTSVKASEYARGLKQYNYVRNPSSNRNAVSVRETGKAFARASDYQGNIKMRKFDLFGKRDLHPDAKFVKLNKNNVAEEKDVFTNFKLWWARLFKKNDTQPDHLKDKRGKPRYDKGEAGLWYD